MKYDGSNSRFLALASERDRSGHRIDYVYRHEETAPFTEFVFDIERIEYTTTGTEAARRKVEFHYNPSDAPVFVRVWDAHTQTYHRRDVSGLLTSIEMFGPNENGATSLAWSYSLNYERSGDTDRMLLLSRGRSASATFFATALAICLVPMGCAASDEYAETPPQPSEPSQPSERTLHPSIVNGLQACANEGVSRLSRHAYDLTFEIDATAKGAIRGIQSKGKRLDDAKMETCLIQALKAMPLRDLLPPDDSLLDDSVPATSQSISPPTRSLIGNAALLPQLIRLVPIVIVVPGGVTIVVAVVLVVAVAVLLPKSPKRSKDECDEEEKWATENCAKWLAMRNPPMEVVGQQNHGGMHF